MSIQQVEIICSVCGTNFTRAKGEVTRSKRLGRQLFCTRSCCGKANIKNIPRETCRHDHLNAANRWDCYSRFRTSLRIARMRSRESDVKECTITLADLKAVWEQQQGRCPYTGWELLIPRSSAAYVGTKKAPQSASLDRIDSSKGYVVGNIQFVSCMANYAKNDFSHEQMIEFCKAVATHWKQSEEVCDSVAERLFL